MHTRARISQIKRYLSVNSPAPELTARVQPKGRVKVKDRVRVEVMVKVRVRVKG